MKIKSEFKYFTKEELNKLKKSYKGTLFYFLSDLLILSYTKYVAQQFLKVDGSKERDFKDLSASVLPIDISDEIFKAYKSIGKLGWKYFSYSFDRKSGYDSIAYTKGETLAIGIAGSDKSYEDWVENDARLVLSKGIIPTQFNIVKEKILGVIRNYKRKNKSYPKEIILAGNSLGGAVASVAYAQLFVEMYDLGINLIAFTYNGAPIRIDYVEETLERNFFTYNVIGEKKEKVEKKLYSNILNIVNEDDILNSLIILVKNKLEKFRHLGPVAIIKSNKKNRSNNEIDHYFLEHISIEALKNIELAEVQDIKYYSKNIDNIVDISKNKIKDNIVKGIDNILGSSEEKSNIEEKCKGVLIGGLVCDYNLNPKRVLSDGTKLTIALSEAIIIDSRKPLEAFGENLVKWRGLDKTNIGKTMDLALENALKYGDFPTGAKNAFDILKKKSAGNGSLKRVAPVAIAYSDLEEVLELITLQSNMTHFHPKVKECCQLFGWLLFEILKGEEKEEVLEKIFSKHPYFSNYKDINIIDELKNPSYVIESLLITLIIFYNTKTFEEGYELLKSVKRSYEFSTITGNLLGTYYGYSSIPKKLLKEVKTKDINTINKITEKLIKIRGSE